MTPTVAILLSTFNGENYIQTQIESLLKQRGCIVEIFLRDDGSKDSTVEIIKKMMVQHPSLHLSEGTNVGYKSSFFELLFSVQHFGFYAFCDQDDIWLDTKLMSAIKYLKPIKGPALYSCKKIYVDSQLNKLNIKDKTPPLTLDYGFFRGGACGCTMVWNDTFHQIIRRYVPKQPFKSHDDYVRCLAIALGVSTFLDENPQILYRRHANNQSILPTKRIYRLFSQGITKFGSRADLKKICEDIKCGYSSELTKDAQVFIEQILAKDSLKSRLELMSNPNLKTIPSWEVYLLKFLIFLRGIN